MEAQSSIYMQTALNVLTTRRPLLAAWLLVCALLLQPAAAAWNGSACDAAGDCCCSDEYVAPDGGESFAGCCSALAPTKHDSAPQLQADGCDCQMEDGAPSEPLTIAVAHSQLLDDSALCVFDGPPLPINVAGRTASSAQESPPPEGSRPNSLSLLVRRLAAGGLLAHLARLATLRL